MSQAKDLYDTVTNRYDYSMYYEWVDEAAETMAQQGVLAKHYWVAEVPDHLEVRELFAILRRRGFVLDIQDKSFYVMAG